jgi:hypothetical protein
MAKVDASETGPLLQKEAIEMNDKWLAGKSKYIVVVVKERREAASFAPVDKAAKLWEASVGRVWKSDAFAQLTGGCESRCATD